MARAEIHVVPTSDGRWGTRYPNHDEIKGRYDTQQAAIDAGRREARVNRMELVIHDENGRIRDSDSGGNDPFPPRDTV
jgi:hypothetical protein